MCHHRLLGLNRQLCVPQEGACFLPLLETTLLSNATSSQFLVSEAQGSKTHGQTDDSSPALPPPAVPGSCTKFCPCGCPTGSRKPGLTPDDGLCRGGLGRGYTGAALTGFSLYDVCDTGPLMPKAVLFLPGKQFGNRNVKADLGGICLLSFPPSYVQSVLHLVYHQHRSTNHLVRQALNTNSLNLRGNKDEEAGRRR